MFLSFAIAERAALGNTMCDAPARHDLRHVGFAVPAASLGHTLPSRVSVMSDPSTFAGNVSVLAIAERAALGNTMCDAPARHDLPDGISAARWFHGPLHLTFTRTVAQWLSEDEDEEDSLSPSF